ncbi:hypothetical protein EKO04_003396 [Ascochyta lentis]|uniref:Uncharacterized protein n=1 Tax=Ascochyta lentis TaxID=205686 RepID=A0A8H7ML93_9PLEO|nr:hypothetical protein EKO04_003396 [Ascochyta lentis]
MAVLWQAQRKLHLPPLAAVPQSGYHAWHHGMSTPVVTHGILEVAEQPARPAEAPSDAGQLNTPANLVWLAGGCRLWTELRSNVRRACMHKPRQSGHGARRSLAFAASRQALIANANLFPDRPSSLKLSNKRGVAGLLVTLIR